MGAALEALLSDDGHDDTSDIWLPSPYRIRNVQAHAGIPADENETWTVFTAAYLLVLREIWAHQEDPVDHQPRLARPLGEEFLSAPVVAAILNLCGVHEPSRQFRQWIDRLQEAIRCAPLH